MRKAAVLSAALLTLGLVPLVIQPVARAQDSAREGTISMVPPPGNAGRAGAGTPAAAGEASDAAAEPTEANEAAAETKGDPAAEAEAAREARLVAMRAHNSRYGSVGGFHVVDAGSGPAGSFRLSLFGEFMVKDDFMLKGDSNTLGGGALAISVTPTRWLELSLATTARSLNNTGDPASPGMLQVFGDVFADVKGFYEVRPGVTLGGDVGVWFLAGQDEVGKDLSATSPLLRLNTSLDLRKLAARPVPMQLRFNVSYLFDNSAKTVQGVENQREDALPALPGSGPEYRNLITRVERFALNINRVDMLELGVGSEWPVETKRVVVSPLLEWSWGIPVNRQGFTCPYPRGNDGNKLPGVDSCLSDEGLNTWPMTVTVGLTLQPKRMEGLSLLLAGVDIAATGSKVFVQELMPNAPYTVYMGAAYAVDVHPRVQVKHVETTRLVPTPTEIPRGRVRGLVTAEGASTPVADARVHFVGLEGASDLLTGSDGGFVSYPFDPGTEVAMQVSAEGHEPGTCTALIPEDASDVQAACTLKALPKVGDLHVVVINAEGGPMAGAQVTVSGPSASTETTTSTGEIDAVGLSPGDYTLRVSHDDHLVKVQPFTIEADETADVRVELRARPKRSAVKVQKDLITLRSGVDFSGDTTELQPRSEEALEELADLLIRTPDIEQVEVQGHLDDSGDAAHTQELSQQRAQVVVDWLVAHGVASQRLFAKGYGGTKALRPNITPRNRELNRRIEFHIVKRTTPPE